MFNYSTMAWFEIYLEIKIRYLYNQALADSSSSHQCNKKELEMQW